jgi:hypothetical protein
MFAIIKLHFDALKSLVTKNDLLPSFCITVDVGVTFFALSTIKSE